MTDPMTTPPLDLPALRDDLRMSTGRTFPIYREELQALLDRLANAESERDLAAVTVSRDGWKTRAEAAEKKVAAVEALVVTAEDAPIEYRNSIQTSHLRAALDGGA